MVAPLGDAHCAHGAAAFAKGRRLPPCYRGVGGRTGAVLLATRLLALSDTIVHLGEADALGVSHRPRASACPGVRGRVAGSAGTTTLLQCDCRWEPALGAVRRGDCLTDVGRSGWGVWQAPPRSLGSTSAASIAAAAAAASRLLHWLACWLAGAHCVEASGTADWLVPRLAACIAVDARSHPLAVLPAGNVGTSCVRYLVEWWQHHRRWPGWPSDHGCHLPHQQHLRRWPWWRGRLWLCKGSGGLSKRALAMSWPSAAHASRCIM